MPREPSFRRYRRFWGADPKRDVDEELAFHMAMRVDEYERAGLSHDDAKEATMKRFGDVHEIRDEVATLAQKRYTRHRRALRLDALILDVKYALRSLLTNPAYTITVVLTLALGIGANAAVFSVAFGVVMRALPYRDADEIVRVWEKNARRNLEFFSVSPATYADWKKESRAFTAMAAFERQRDATLTTKDEPLSVSITAVTPDIFPLLGTSPALGRALVADDAQASSPAVAVMSHDLWATSFGSDPAVVGRDVIVDGKRYSVVGVMPRRFSVPGTNAELWMPLSFTGVPDSHGFRYLRVLGRLAPGVTATDANAQLDVISARIAATFPADAAGWSANILRVPEMIVGTQFRRAMLTLIGVVALVLLIACSNAANLQLARSTVRERELAIRAALGASRGRIVRQLLTESVLLSAMAGAVGLAMAYGGVELLRAMGETTVPRLEDVRLDAPVIVFTILVALATGVLFGLIPAWRSARSDVSETLKSGGRSLGQTPLTAMLRGGLVVAEMSLSLVLLIGAGLLLRSFARLQAVDIGFNDQRLVIAPTALPQASYSSAEQIAAFYSQALERARALGGVESVAAVSSAPFAGVNPGTVFLRFGDAPPAGAQPPDADLRVITPGYFGTMGIRLLRGRDFTPDDRDETTPVVIISSAMAKTHWPGENPVGQRIRVGDVVKGTPHTIVGVVGDVRYQSLVTDVARPMMYFPVSASAAPRSMTIVVRTSADGASASSSLRTMLASIDRRLPAPTVTAMTEIVGRALATQRFALTLFVVFAILAGALAAIGLYGVTSYLVRQRTRELGIRVALGAQRHRLLTLVVGGALRLTVIGVAVGLAASYALTESLRTLLFGVSPTDARTFVALALLLASISILASLVPALRATRADPMLALRGDG